MAPAITFTSLLACSAVLRLALIAWGLWQDANLEVPYTDIDYLVVTDGAALVVNGVPSPTHCTPCLLYTSPSPRD